MKANEILNEAFTSGLDENKVLYDFYVKSLDEVLEAKSILDKREKEIRAKIAKYSQGAIDYAPVSVIGVGAMAFELANYPFNGAWADKIDFVLSQSGGELSAREISNAIERIEPALAGKTNASVYPTLSDNEKKGKKYTKRFDESIKANKFSIKK